jgi:hypothetical protein
VKSVVDAAGREPSGWKLWQSLRQAAEPDQPFDSTFSVSPMSAAGDFGHEPNDAQAPRPVL